LPTEKKARVRASKRQAGTPRRTRDVHPSETTWHYLKLIADLLEASDGGPVLAVELVRRFGVAQPTVANVLKRLRRQSLVASEAGAALRLTKQGRTIAQECKRRHEIVLKHC